MEIRDKRCVLAGIIWQWVCFGLVPGMVVQVMCCGPLSLVVDQKVVGKRSHLIWRVGRPPLFVVGGGGEIWW